MNLLSLAFHSLGLDDVGPPRDDLLQVECNDALEKGDDISERGCKLRTSRKKSRDELPTISLDEVAWHETSNDCWLVIHDYVYDCTKFLRIHPCGQEVLLEYAGRDATLAFIGAGHSAFARTTLDRYVIGELPPEERIYRTPNGVKIF